MRAGAPTWPPVRDGTAQPLPSRAVSAAKSGRKAANPVRTYGNRVDAEQKRKQILDAAVALLGKGSTPSMADLAKVAIVGRATLYRHFPSLDDVLAAIPTHAVDELEQAITNSRLEDDSVVEAMERLFAELMEVGDRYRFLVSEPTTVTAETARALSDGRLGTPIFALMRRGQASGELSRTLPAEWMASVLGGILVTALREIDTGRLERTEAVQVATATALNGLRAPT